MRKNAKKNLVRIGLIQMRSGYSSALNFAKALKYVQKAAHKGAQIICLGELFKTDYFPQTRNRDHFRLAEPIPGPTTEIFSELARKLKVVLIVPVFEKMCSTSSVAGQVFFRADGAKPVPARTGTGFYNAAVTIDADGSILGLYRKMHIPNDPCYYEKFYFAPGGLGFEAYETRYGKIGVLICWDQWFP